MTCTELLEPHQKINTDKDKMEYAKMILLAVLRQWDAEPVFKKKFGSQIKGKSNKNFENQK